MYTCTNDFNVILFGASIVGIITGVMLCYFNCFAPIIQRIKTQSDINPDKNKV